MATGLFDPQNTVKFVTAVMAAIPEGKTSAGVGYYNLSGTWRIGFAHRTTDGTWAFMGHVGQDVAHGNIQGEFQVVWSK